VPDDDRSLADLEADLNLLPWRSSRYLGQHWYAVRDADPELFDAVRHLIGRDGHREEFDGDGRTYTYLDGAAWRYWIAPWPCLNRARRAASRTPQAAKNVQLILD
jgi:hypothetical protein